MATKKQLKKPSTPKVNKDARPRESDPRIVNDDTYRCSCCGYPYKKQEHNFNKSLSPIYKGNNGYMTICKECMGQLLEEYVDFYAGNETAAGEHICRLTDTYFNENYWAAARKRGNIRNRYGVYISKLNLNQAQLGTTFSDTLIQRWEAEQKEAEEAAKHRTLSDEHEVTADEETVRRFGAGFTNVEYDSMQAEYDSWVKKYGEPIDKRQDELYITICYLKLNLQKSLLNDASGIGTLANSYKGFIEAATTEIEDRRKKEEAEIEANPLGVWIRDIEQYTPAEFYRDKPLYRDYDALKEYMERFIARPLRNLLIGSKEMDK